MESSGTRPSMFLQEYHRTTMVSAPNYHGYGHARYIRSSDSAGKRPPVYLGVAPVKYRLTPIHHGPWNILFVPIVRAEIGLLTSGSCRCLVT